MSEQDPSETAPRATLGADPVDPNPRVSVRIPLDVRAVYIRAQGQFVDPLRSKSSSLSLPLQAVLEQGLFILDPDLRGQVSAVAATEGWTLEQAWRQLVLVGLQAISKVAKEPAEP